MESTHSQKLLGVREIVRQILKDHVSNLCKKVSAKISAMARVFPFMFLNQGKLIMKAILISQFGYYPLVWMGHNRTNIESIIESIACIRQHLG